MPIRQPVSPNVTFRPGRALSRAVLLAGVSAATLLAIGMPAQARNILSLGGGSSAVASTTASALTAAEQAATAAAQAQNSLATVTRAIQAMQTAQSAARALSLTVPSTVPNGLTTGGLVPDSGLAGPGVANPVTTWVGANTPTQTTSNGQTTVTIQQTQPQALLNWQTFNVGTQTTVDFNQQGNATWVALNQIAASGVPSQILGSIKADGQVYLINPNGIIFGGGSQINVNALIASSANISTSQFLNNGIYSTETSGTYNPSFTAAGGAIVVDAGAEIETPVPTTVDAGGGYVMLLGTQVTNNGTIVTPDGQTLLAAGDNFLIRPGYSSTANEYSTTAGNEVAIQLNTLGSSITGGSGIVANNGYIEADTGDITLVGETVTQNGVLLSTTSVAQRGTIHLLSSASDPDSSVTLTGNSVTDILPELDSTATALESQRAGLIAQAGLNTEATGQFDDLSTIIDQPENSRVEIVTGGNVEFQGNSLTQAPGGQVAVSAAGRIQVDTDATIDVSGSNITLPMIDNFMQVNIQGEEESDDPQNRDTGNLFDDDVWVDERTLLYVPAGTGGYTTARYYSEGGLLNVTGEYANVGATIGQWTASGGTITLAAGSVVAQTGSVFDIAGGSITYQGGMVPQTYLLGSNGLIYNANTAPSNITYVGLYNGYTVDHSRWGITETYVDPLHTPAQVYEAGYTVGRDGGELVLGTATAIFEGEIEAGVIDGTQQTSARPTTITDPFLESQTTVPLAGSLIIDAATADQGLPTGLNSTVTIGAGDPLANSLSVGAAIPADRVGTIVLDASQLDSFGLGGLVIGPTGSQSATGGSITISEPLTLADGGQLDLGASTIAVNADVTAPGGVVTMIATTFSGAAANLTVGPNVIIDTTGLWTNAQLNPANQSGLAFVNGGAVTLSSTGNLVLEPGSLIDASSGGAILDSGADEGGAGGAITLIANDRTSTTNTDPFGAEGLVLDGVLRSEGVTQGGSLTLSTYGVVAIGAQPLLTNGMLASGVAAPTELTLASNLVLPADSAMPFTYVSGGTTYASGSILSNSLTLPAGTLVPEGTVFSQDVQTQVVNLAPSFFGQGFSAYNITGQNVVVAPNTVVNVTEPVLEFTNASTMVPTGSNAEAALSLWLPPTYLPNPVTGQLTQRAGASLSLSASLNILDAIAALNAGATGPNLAPLSIGQGATLSVDPGQAINLQAWGEIDVEGTINAPGGSISVLNTQPVNSGVINLSTNDAYELEGAPEPSLSVWIGSTADLNVAGQAVTALDQYGRPYGFAPNGGSITLGSAGTALNADGVLASTPAFVIIRPGAVLDASGTSATVDFAAGTSPSSLDQITSSGPELVASNGGSIALSSYSGLYIEGDLTAAAGGPGAAGGTLSLTLPTPIYNTNNTGSDRTGGAQFTLTNNARQLRIISVDQEAESSGLSATLAPGATDPALVFGYAHIGVNQIASGGFANLSLFGGDAIAFDGNVNLSLAQSLTLSQGQISLSAATPNAQVTLSAPYVFLDGFVGAGPNTEIGDIQYIAQGQSQTTAGGVLTINADQLDIQNAVGFGLHDTISEASGSTPSTVIEDLPGFATVSLVSQGDITFLSSTNGTYAGQTSAAVTSLVTTGNLDLTAAMIYPATDAQAYVIAGAAVTGSTLSSTGTITISGVGSGDPTPPDSVFGELLLLASNIQQGGVVEAPMGALYIGSNDPQSLSSLEINSNATGTTTVDFLPGSITSVSANGLTIPYGGTSDGLNYLYNGAAAEFINPLDATNTIVGSGSKSGTSLGIQIGSQSIDIQQGALLDLSGGGDLAGAGFISGEGGSVDVLRTPLVNANPTNVGSASDKVYAIVPGYQGGYAPIAPDAGDGNPTIGEQITIGAGVPGLPAGTYTLLPSTYALLPGAFRVEVGGTNTSLSGVASLPNGSFETAGDLGVANTSIRSPLPTELILTPANTVTTYSQYNQTSYAQFAETQSTTFGTPLPALPMDAKLLLLDFGTTLGSGTPLTVDGTVNMSPATVDGETGANGTLIVASGYQGANYPIEILGPGGTPTPGSLSLAASDLDTLADGGAIVIGGVFSEGYAPAATVEANPQTTSDGVISYNETNGALTIDSGAVLSGSQIFLLSASSVTVQAGATLTTAGAGAAPWDSNSENLLAAFTGIALSNGGVYAVPPSTPYNTNISIASGAQLLSNGDIVLASPGGLTLGSSVTFGASNLDLTTTSVNIGTDSSLAAATTAGILPSGWSLDQTTLNNLIAGNSATGVPPLQSLTLTVSNSVNFFGTVDLTTINPTTGQSDLDLMLNTPAIYGFGAAGDVATLTTGTLTWNGAASVTYGSSQTVTQSSPGPVIANGPGTGSGTLDLVAQQIVFGYPANVETENSVPLNRLTLGFSTVNLEASGSITANNTGTLSVYQTQTTSGSNTVDSGGTLNIVTPLLTGAPGSVMSYTSGGALNVTAPAGATAVDTSTVTALGATLNLTGSTVTIDTEVALPTGALTVNATGDITLGAGADIDLSGRATPMFDQTEYSWGGTLQLLSAGGNITQAAGSVIDVSAVDNTAGSITAQAVSTTGGQVALNGTLLGASTLTSGDTGDYLAGSITVDAQTLTSGSGANLTGDFAALNAALDAGGFFGARSFDLKQGDLTINGTLQAQTINISVDDGSLIVDGTIDASGATPGSISLAAMDNLTLASTGLLDAHGTVLQADSYGNPIDAENQATVNLTATTGTLTLASGSTINVSSPDPNPQGDVELNASRTGSGGASATGAGAPANAKGNGVDVVATGTVNITGAGTIAVNGFATYANAPADPNDANGQTITQTYLNQINTDSTAFMTAADANSIFQANLAGLIAYGATFHLRPGVEIDSATPDGDLSITTSIDLSGYRYSDPVGYGLQVNNSVYGSGEPGTLIIRAGGNLNVDGSITDGFSPPPTTPDTATKGPIYPLAAMLPAGDLSWSIELVSGADLTAADTRIVKPSQLLLSSGATGNLTLSDSHNVVTEYLYNYYGQILPNPNPSICNYYQCVGTTQITLPGADPSVIRTGTGNLQLIAGGNFDEESLYGIYTAGTQSPSIAAADETPRSTQTNGTVLGAANAAYNTADAGYQAYYPTDGGDLTLTAQGDISGDYVETLVSGESDYIGYSDAIGNWLWRQGGAGIDQPAAWWINFGTYVLPRDPTGNIDRLDATKTPQMVGFEGIGTLGGGNLNVVAGGDAGVLTAPIESGGVISSTALDLVVASTGRVLPNGTLLETGGGNLNVTIGGALNPGGGSSDSAGLIANLRGNTVVKAGSIGQVSLLYGAANADDPRAADPLNPIYASISGGPILAPGDGTITLQTLGDLAVSGAVDPGRVPMQNATSVTTGGVTGDGYSWFTLWTANSGIVLDSAGGNVSPENVLPLPNDYADSTILPTDLDKAILYPPSLDVIATGGSIYYGGAGATAQQAMIELAPSPVGSLEMLAEGSIYGDAVSTGMPYLWAMSGAAASTEATPFNPGYTLFTHAATNTNSSSIISTANWTSSDGVNALFTFGPDTVTSDIHADDPDPALFYAVTGEIFDLRFGDIFQPNGSNIASPIYYIGATSADILAGGDIVDLGAPYVIPLADNQNTGQEGSGNDVGDVNTFILNNSPNDVSVISAGGNIYYANVVVGGPGTLEVMAGGNIYQGDHGLIESIGPIYDIDPYDHSAGASIIIMPGVGAAGPDWSAFAELYFDPANQGDPEQNPDDVAQTYQAQLYQWLQQNYDYTGTQADALAYFLGLPVPQQSVFDLQVYFDELNASGLEFNEPSSLRYKSYVRGKEAIATLFPSTNAAGQSIDYSGSLIMDSGDQAFFVENSASKLWDSGVHTEFGGSIQIVDPGGAVTVGSNAITPGPNTGILTEGSGDVDIYALGSVELGLSRIFTTFGGNIVIWSATGDINAGRGAKGTVVFTPARRVYDAYGNVALSPTVPSSGAGIATLAPIPEVPAGNINLVAPLGIVDAGEAGIRVSGNLNIAALQVINAANIQVQGTATGIPETVAPNISGLTAAANTAGAATNAAENAARQSRQPYQPQDLPSIFTVEVIGYGGGDEPDQGSQDDQRRRH